jgi:hypothetical protein
MMRTLEVRLNGDPDDVRKLADWLEGENMLTAPPSIRVNKDRDTQEPTGTARAYLTVAVPD